MMKCVAGALVGIGLLASTLVGCSNSETGRPLSVPSTSTSASTTTATDTTSTTSEPEQAESVVLNCKHEPEVRPAEIVFFCGDGNGYVNDISWNSWETETASGSGTLNMNDCTPSCAGGTFVRTPVTIDISDPIGADNHFTLATVTYPDGSTKTYQLTK